MTFTGKVALITGGATGIGLAIAKTLAARGARVVIAQPELQQAQEAAALFHGEGVQVDVSDALSVDRAVENVVAACGRIDILVNSASVTGREALQPLLSITGEQLDRIVDTNLKGTIYCSRAVANRMVESGVAGSIVHIAPVAAFAAQESAAV